MDNENNSFYNSQHFNSSQNFNPSQGYYPNQYNFPNSAENEISFQNLSQNTVEEELQTNVNVSNNPQAWSDQEDVALMSAWCFASTNAVVGTNQTNNKLWATIRQLYEEGRADTPGLCERSLELLRSRWRRLNTNVTKWTGVYKKAHDRARSGESKEDIEKAAQQLYGPSKFTHHEVFERVMRHNPKWELKLNSTGSTRFQPDEDDLEESRGSSKRSRTSEDGDTHINSTPGSSGIQRPIGRNKAKANSKRKGKDVASQSHPIPDDFTETLREMRITRERECGIQERKIQVAREMQDRNIKATMLNTLMSKGDLSPGEENLKQRLMEELFGM